MRNSVEGRRKGEWILLDYVDFVVHVFLAERRAFYDIERLRKSARPLTPAEFDAELKAALAEKTLRGPQEGYGQEDCWQGEAGREESSGCVEGEAGGEEVCDCSQAKEGCKEGCCEEGACEEERNKEIAGEARHRQEVVATRL